MLRASLLPILGLVSACVGPSTMQTAQTLGEGRWQWSVDTSLQGAAGIAGATSYPAANVGVQYGVTEEVDVGTRLGADGISVLAKWAPSQVQRWRWSLAPKLSGAALSLGGVSTGFVSFELPWVVDVPLREHALTVAPKWVNTVGWRRANSHSATAYIMSAGATVGMRAQLSKRWSVLPELGVLIPVSDRSKAHGVGGGNIATPATALVFQFTLGVMVN